MKKVIGLILFSFMGSSIIYASESSQSTLHCEATIQFNVKFAGTPTVKIPFQVLVGKSAEKEISLNQYDPEMKGTIKIQVANGVYGHLNEDGQVADNIVANINITHKLGSQSATSESMELLNSAQATQNYISSTLTLSQGPRANGFDKHVLTTVGCRIK